MSKKDRVPEVLKLEDGKELIVRSPNLTDYRAAQKVYNSTYKEAVESGAFLRVKLDDFAKKQGIWNEEKQAEYSSIVNEVVELEKRIDAGGIKLSEARGLALEMIKKRYKLRSLISERTELDNKSAEGQAENAKFNSLLSSCLVYKDTGSPYFSGLDDYLNNAESDEAGWAAGQLTRLLYKLDNNFEAKLPEYKFLKEFGFVDEKLRLINKDGHLIDEDGRLINEEGKYVDKNNNLVDKEGNRVDEEGNFIFDRKPFLDDDGSPIVKVEEKKVENVAETAPVVEEPVVAEAVENK